ncbi:MAG: 1-deoxy-D-xylulose-5-phosphate synthase [Candidatus Roizmanbacteria bacterium]|nr:1-deoxy-D-xylulose-5-phosphate synthase [Candidatus Roizmanbacteria bacterium]
MRDGIISEIYNTMERNKNVYLLTGDLGYNTLEKIEKDFPDRFIDVGVAEQNMIGIASGLALSGKKVYIYSIIPFLIMRCYEQIRNDICYHDLDITLVGIGAGLAYGILSNTHFALEDIAILRPLPNMTIFSPADEVEAIEGMKYLSSHPHPTYVRVGLRKEAVVSPQNYIFHFGKASLMQKGVDVCIFTTGSITDEVIRASKLLTLNKKITPTIINLHTIKPLDKNTILKEALKASIIFTIEEHGKIGGLGSAISDIISESAHPIRVIKIGTTDVTSKIVGTRAYLRKILGLDAEGIYKTIVEHLK